jgi:hypothetical protein
MSLPPPPIKSPMYGPGGAMTSVWVQWLQRLYANLGGAAAILPVISGGTGLAVGVSGGILGFTSTTALASSALLTANALVLGGGAGVTPSTPVGLGVSTQVLHGNIAGAPSWAAVNLSADVSGTLPAVNGGTGFSSYTAGDLLYASSGTALSKLADVATGNALISGGVGTPPSWGKVGLTTHVTGTLPEGNGGTNQSTYTTGDVLYSSAANTLSKLAGNITATRKFLRQTGSGAASAAPAWDTIVAADIPGSALTKTDDTNVTLTLGGSPTTALLNAASLTLGWTGQLGLTRGGTAASLTASNGGIVYSTASALAILAGTATAGQILRSGASTTPAWSTPTFPNTATANKALVGDGTNVVLSTPTIPLTSAPTSGKIMIGDGTNWVASTPTWPTAAGSAKNVPRSDGTNFVAAQLAASDLSNGTTGSGAVALAASPTFTGTAVTAILNVGTSGSSYQLKVYQGGAGGGVVSVQGVSGTLYESNDITTSYTPNFANAAMWIAKDSTTSRSIDAAGTLNASGADYAEYHRKASPDLSFAKGDAVRFDAPGA